MTIEITPTMPPVPETRPPLDPGDAGGVGNGTERTMKPGELHETAEEAEKRGQ